MKSGLEITGGEKRGHKIRVPKGIRPTQGVVKRSLFDSLGEWIRGKRVLELFAGSGAVGFEALSRGADFVVFVDRARASQVAIFENAQKLGYRDRIWFRKEKADKALRALSAEGAQFDLIFADPPYQVEDLQKVLDLVAQVLAPDGIFVLELGHKTPVPKVPGLVHLREIRHGETVLHFYGHLSGDL